MNIFLPYEFELKKSVEALDDKRLNKQIIECIQLLNAYERVKKGEGKVGYSRHPIFLHYTQDMLHISMVVKYCNDCCIEYFYRFNKLHKLEGTMLFYKNIYHENWENIEIAYQPYYMEGSLGQPNYVRTYKNVSNLYQRKLAIKWENDKIKPVWTNRNKPDFWRNEND